MSEQPVEMFRWGLTRIHFGMGVVEQLGDICAEVAPDARRVVLFCGRTSLRKSGLLSRLQETLSQRAAVTVCDGIPSNPTPEAIDHAARMLSEASPDILIAVGGGSVIDAAKVANCAAGAGVPTRDLLAGRAATRLALSFVAVPTTAGTGSEVTPFATVWDREASRKLSLDTPLNLPDAAVLDPELTISMTPDLTRQTAADAFGHALESLWSRRRSALSEALSFAAIAALVQGVPRVRREPDNRSARTRVLRGSLLAGMAIGLTRTAAAHAISYALTLRFGIPHGIAVAELLPGVFAANRAALPDHVVESLAAALASGDGVQVVEALTRFLAAEGMIDGLGRFGMQPSDVRSLAEVSAVAGRMDNNLIPLSRAQIENILTGALHRSERGAAILANSGEMA